MHLSYFDFEVSNEYIQVAFVLCIYAFVLCIVSGCVCACFFSRDRASANQRMGYKQVSADCN